MKKLLVISLCLFLITACATSKEGGPAIGSGLGSAFKGITHLILSPVQIAAGLLEGISSMPYYLSTNIHAINRGLIKAQAKVTLDDTYEAAYGKRLSEIPESGNTGEVFRRMKHATRFFQNVLSQYGIPDANRYILTSIDTANNEGYTLFAVVYRPLDAITVIDKYNGQSVRSFKITDRLFYEPFEKDKNGRSLDTIIDWAGMPRDLTKTQKAQAVLITMAANAVINKKRSPDYWEIERRWIAGEFREITEQKMGNVRNSMGI